MPGLLLVSVGVSRYLSSGSPPDGLLFCTAVWVATFGVLVAAGVAVSTGAGADAALADETADPDAALWEVPWEVAREAD